MNYFIFCCFVLCVTAQYEIPDMEREKGRDFWMENMKKDLQDSLNRKINTNIAKNVIIFVGDGMGVTATTAGRIYKGQKKGFSGEEGRLVWEDFPNVSLMKTYNLDRQVPDSAGTATAYFGGAKANYLTIGVDGNVKVGDCEASLDEDKWISSVVQWAQDAGKDTGFVTTTRVTHATPAALYAHSSYRFWECDADMNSTVLDTGCKDMARQLIENEPGKNINVIFGGGRQPMGAPLPEDTNNDTACTRDDKRNLVEEWLQDKEDRQLSAKYISNTKALLELDVENLEFIMGLFGGDHTSFEIDRDTTLEGSPSIKQMTETAIKRLQRSENGYVLMVEGGQVDVALHMSLPRTAMEEILALDEAVDAAINMVDEEDTLIIVTADHSHVMTINGYPQRGNDILGKTVSDETVDKLPYPTLMFTTGPGFSGTFTWNGTHVVRADLTDVDTTSKDWVSPSIVETKDTYYATHGGEDVATFAKGPMAHLFEKVHEQSYVAHVMGFSACIGPYEGDCERPQTVSEGKILRPTRYRRNRN